MENIIWLFIFGGVIYFVVRNAVRDGLIEYDKYKSEEQNKN